jgi:eukaryotic-like serine/threonine-protein kinase
MMVDVSGRRRRNGSAIMPPIMNLTPGMKLGPYELVAFIGAGGMGEVYRAKDLRLGREVAIKILPPSFAADADRLRRFEQEARAVAALSHPNILGVHDIGQHEGAPFLVSELLEGETLREVLARGIPSHRKAIDYAVQIAHGLAAAHGKDIAHRDLKPDNIFITRDGRVKILDFGLAKTVVRRAGAGRESTLGTMTAAAPATEAGTVMGTASYMSPEQVRGEEVDCRTDIFSFGTVLYEMLSGTRAFKRDTTAETMTAILKEDAPELSDSGRQIPPALDRIVRHCMEKAPEQRFQSARDLAFDLESITTVTGSGGVSAAKVKEYRRRWYLAAIATAVMVAAAAGWLLSSARPVGNATFHQVTYRRGTLDNARFTPDGKNIIYTAAWETPDAELYTVASVGVEGHPLGIKNARLLAISKSGELAVALAPSGVTNLIIPGNLARTTGTDAPKPEVENVQAADFTPDGSALAIVRYVPQKLICQVEYPIGKVLYSEKAIDYLRFSPDGKYLAFITHTEPSDDRGNVVIVKSSGEKVTQSPTWESAGGLAWNALSDEVWSTSPLESGDVHTLSISGKTRTPLTVPGRLRLQDIGSSGELLVVQGIARRGIVVSLDNGQTQRDLSWLDFSYLRNITYDGKTILFEEEGSTSKDYKIFLRDVDGSPAVPIGDGYSLAISRDKKWVLGQKKTEPIQEIWLYPVGPGEPRRISPPKLVPEIAAKFLSDGKRVVYMAHEVGHPSRTWLHDLSGGEPRPITPEGIAGFLISPDDRWLITFKREEFGVGHLAFLTAVEGGERRDIKGLKAGDGILGWTSDNQIYVGRAVGGTRLAVSVEKLNPLTGARTPWRVLGMPPIGGIAPDPPIITPDGSAVAFDYRMRLADLYTVKGVR